MFKYMFLVLRNYHQPIDREPAMPSESESVP